jgi:hypothetical protein
MLFTHANLIVRLVQRACAIAEAVSAGNLAQFHALLTSESSEALFCDSYPLIDALISCTPFCAKENRKEGKSITTPYAKFLPSMPS